MLNSSTRWIMSRRYAGPESLRGSENHRREISACASNLKGIDTGSLDLFGYELLEGNLIEESGKQNKVLFGEDAVYNFFTLDAT